MRSLTTKSTKGQEGVILILFGLSVVLIVSLIALVIGLGVITTNKMKLQNAANLAALGGLDMVLREYPPGTTNQDRARFAIEAASRILAGTRLHSDKAHAELPALDILTGKGANYTFTSSSSGYGEFGVWAFSPGKRCGAADESLECRCGAGPAFRPCFVPLEGWGTASPTATTRWPNAMRIVTRTPERSWIAVPFARIFAPSLAGGSGERRLLSASAIATVYERCTAFVLDISGSSVSESHNKGDYPNYTVTQESNPTSPMLGRPRILRPVDPGMFAMRMQTASTPTSLITQSMACTDAPAKKVAANGTIVDDYSRAPWNRERVHWCSMPATRPAPPAVADYPHYQSDYELEHTANPDMLSRPERRVWIDRFTQPEPLRSFMLAFNAALRRMEQQRTATDRVVFLPFTKMSFDTNGGPKAIPAGLGGGTTSDVPFLIDMTDMSRAGRRVWSGGSWTTIDEISPNYIERGWFPILTDGHTDLVGAMQMAISRLGSCSASAKKSIVLASDGIPTVYYEGFTNEDNTSCASRPGGSCEDMTFSGRAFGGARSYLSVERRLLDKSNSYGILKQLLDNKISLTVLLAGRGIEPNFRNLVNDAAPPPVLDVFGAVGRGAARFSDPPSATDFVNPSPSLPSPLPPEMANDPHCKTGDPNDCAYHFVGSLPNVIFRRPNYTLGKLAVESKGILCPLMPVASSACYTSQGTWNDAACSRTPGTFQTKSLLNVDMGGQAAACAESTIGPPPFTLVAEE